MNAQEDWPEEWRRFVYRVPPPRAIIRLEDIRRRKEVLAELKRLAEQAKR